MNATHDKTVTICGDVLGIYWTGSVWVSPCNGQQHSSARAAMRAEIERYYTDCGDDIDNPNTAAEIDGYLSQMRG